MPTTIVLRSAPMAALDARSAPSLFAPSVSPDLMILVVWAVVGIGVTCLFGALGGSGDLSAVAFALGA